MAIRPESFGALLYHFGTRKLSFLKSRKALTLVEALADYPDAVAACAAAGITEAERPAYLAALGTLAESQMLINEALRDHRRAAARRAVRARAGRADLPDVGTDLRLQPVLRALPVVFRPS